GEGVRVFGGAVGEVARAGRRHAAELVRAGGERDGGRKGLRVLDAEVVVAGDAGAVHGHRVRAGRQQLGVLAAAAAGGDRGTARVGQRPGDRRGADRRGAGGQVDAEVAAARRDREGVAVGGAGVHQVAGPGRRGAVDRAGRDGQRQRDGERADGHRVDGDGDVVDGDAGADQPAEARRAQRRLEFGGVLRHRHRDQILLVWRARRGRAAADRADRGRAGTHARARRREGDHRGGVRVSEVQRDGLVLLVGRGQPDRVEVERDGRLGVAGQLRHGEAVAAAVEDRSGGGGGPEGLDAVRPEVLRDRIGEVL